MRHIPVAIAVLLCVFAFLPHPVPKTGPVASALANASRSDRGIVSRTYSALAQKTQEDGGRLITTVGMWRQLHINALKACVSKVKGKYPGLDVAVERVLDDAFPLDDVAMSEEMVGKIVAGCMEVAKQSE